MGTNAFYAATGRLDRKYLRVCVVYRLLSRGVIGKERALELLAQRHSPQEMRSLNNTVAQWHLWSIKKMAA